MEATRGDGYAPVWGSPVMMMMMIVCSSIDVYTHVCCSSIDVYTHVCCSSIDVYAHVYCSSIDVYTHVCCSSIDVYTHVCCAACCVDVGCKLRRWSRTPSLFHCERGNVKMISC